MDHLYTLADLDRTDLLGLLERADRLRDVSASDVLRGRSVVLLFLSPSLRTRVSMELAAKQLGAEVVTLISGKGLWKLEMETGVVMRGEAAEHIREAAGVLGRYGDLLAVRAFPARESWEEDREDGTLRAIMRWADVPVVNLESTLHHPCQALADILTIRRERGEDPGKIVLTWADHPKALPVAVPSSFALGVTRMGWDLTIARPEGYDLPPGIMARCRDHVAEAGGSLETTADREAAFDGARIVYAKSWGRIDRYGRDARELAERSERDLHRWIVDGAIMERTDGASFLHCLPVRRNVVVSDGVLDSEASRVLDLAENRLHGQKAILERLLAGGR